MTNPKIPQGYHGTYANAADGSATLIMVSRSDSIVENTEKKEHKKSMSNQPANEQLTMPSEQPQGQFKPYTTEQKKEYAKQFTPEQRKSYRQGQKSAYGHMGNIGRRNSLYIHGNLQRDEAATPPPAPPADNKPKGNSRKNSTNK